MRHAASPSRGPAESNLWRPPLQCLLLLLLILLPNAAQCARVRQGGPDMPLHGARCAQTLKGRAVLSDGAGAGALCAC